MGRSIALAFLMAILSGCQTVDSTQNEVGLDDVDSDKPDLHFNEIVVKNSGFRDIHNLEIRVSKTNAIFSCGVLLAKSFCSNKFKPRLYEQNAVTLNWNDDGINRQKGPLVAWPPKDAKEGIYTIVLEVNGDGGYNAEFKLQEGN